MSDPQDRTEAGAPGAPAGGGFGHDAPASPVPTAFGDDAFGDDAYGDDAYADDHYGEGPDSFAYDEPPKSIARSVVEWAAWLGGALVVALLLQAFVVQAFYIPSESMLPTLEKNDRVVVNKLWYNFRDVNRGDIVVFKAPREVAENDGRKYLVKRVIGLPGDTVEGRADGSVYINGEKLEEPWLPEGTRTEPFGPFVVPAGEYFMMGDYRANSRDSRFFPRHYIPEGDIVGRAFVRIWPINRFDLL